MDLKLIGEWTSLIANALTVVTASVALWVYFSKKKEISAAFNMLLNWSYQSTLTDLTGKLDRLNEYNAKEAADLPEIKNILEELAGQVRGNPRLMKSAPELAPRLEKLARGSKILEPAKRSMVAEVRETIRNIKVNSMSTHNE